MSKTNSGTGERIPARVPNPHKIKLVLFHDCDTGVDYSVRSEKECRDSMDKSVYREVLRANDIITMGHTIAWPSA